MEIKATCDNNKRPIDKLKVPFISSDLFSTRDNKFYPLYIWCHPIINALPDEIIYSYPINTYPHCRITGARDANINFKLTSAFYGHSGNVYTGKTSVLLYYSRYTSSGQPRYAVFYTNYMVYSIDINGKFDVIFAITANTISDLLEFAKINTYSYSRITKNLFIIYNEEHLNNFSSSFKRRIKMLYNDLMNKGKFTKIIGGTELIFGNLLTLKPNIKSVNDFDEIRSKSIQLLVNDCVTK